jgi:hypothetical protein
LGYNFEEEMNSIKEEQFNKAQEVESGCAVESGVGILARAESRY